MFLRNKITHEEDGIMVRVSSIFSQLLSLIDRADFHRLVKKHQADKHSKGYSCWEQCVAMLFCQLGQAKSIREICGGLACCVGKMRHLGFSDAPKKSTLAYANTHRPWELYRDLFYQIHDRCRTKAPRHKFKFKNKLLSLDSSTISLCLSMFSWAEYRTKKGAVKLHLLLDHDGYLPTYAYISNGKRSDVKVAHHVPLPKGSIVAMDRGYNDYSMFSDWTESGIFFVTRLKDNAKYYVEEELSVPRNRNILADQIIVLADYDKCPHPLRRVVVWDAENNREVVLMTNHLKFGATTISAIYKERWQIELFFKALKQNLRVKTFVGTSENALHIQIWTALIAVLLIKYLQFISKIAWSFSNLVALLHWNLFTYRELHDWINDPFATPPLEPGPLQQKLFA
jgi:hypothetical protein